MHGKNGVSAYINGKFLTLFKCSYFTGLKEKYIITGVFGDKEIVSMVSGIVCYEGTLENSTIASIYAEGLLGEINIADNKAVFKMPEENIKPEYSNLMEIHSEDFEESYMIVNNLFIEHKNILVNHVYGNLHPTNPIKNALLEVSALPEIIAMIKTPQQPKAIAYICELICRSPNNYKFFIENSG